MASDVMESGTLCEDVEFEDTDVTRLHDQSVLVEWFNTGDTTEIPRQNAAKTLQQLMQKREFTEEQFYWFLPTLMHFCPFEPFTQMLSSQHCRLANTIASVFRFMSGRDTSFIGYYSHLNELEVPEMDLMDLARYFVFLAAALDAYTASLFYNNKDSAMKAANFLDAIKPTCRSQAITVGVLRVLTSCQYRAILRSELCTDKLSDPKKRMDIRTLIDQETVFCMRLSKHLQDEYLDPKKRPTNSSCKTDDVTSDVKHYAKPLIGLLMTEELRARGDRQGQLYDYYNVRRYTENFLPFWDSIIQMLEDVEHLRRKDTVTPRNNWSRHYTHQSKTPLKFQDFENSDLEEPFYQHVTMQKIPETYILMARIRVFTLLRSLISFLQNGTRMRTEPLWKEICSVLYRAFIVEDFYFNTRDRPVVHREATTSVNEEAEDEDEDDQRDNGDVQCDNDDNQCDNDDDSVMGDGDEMAYAATSCSPASSDIEDIEDAEDTEDTEATKAIEATEATKDAGCTTNTEYAEDTEGRIEVCSLLDTMNCENERAQNVVAALLDNRPIEENAPITFEWVKAVLIPVLINTGNAILKDGASNALSDAQLAELHDAVTRDALQCFGSNSGAGAQGVPGDSDETYEEVKNTLLYDLEQLVEDFISQLN